MILGFLQKGVDSDKDSGDDTSNSGDGSTSKLTEDMTIGELLKLTRIVTTTIWMSEVDGGIMKRMAAGMETFLPIWE